MKTTIRTIAAAAALIAAVSIAPTANAFMGGEGPSLVGQHFKKVAAELKLSTQQRQDIRTILKNDRDQLMPLLQQLKTEQRRLRTLIQSDHVDEGAIRSQSARVAAVQGDLAVERARIAQKVREVLTPDQVQKVKVMQARRDSRRDKIGERFMNWIEEEN